CGSNSVESSARPIGREAAKKKGKKKSKEAALEVLDKDWESFREFKAKELERLDNIALMHQEANKMQQEANRIAL
ncbi:hypothetical protein A2U01_0101182, partial [Trifolium medium]|nr:hypothetical protein [Trifolium medium]